MKGLFNKKFVNSVVSGPDAAFIVEDRLTSASDASITVSATPGYPATADCIAYNATQRLLMISTSAGHVKVMGKDGVDVSIACSCGPTLSLLSVPFAGAVVRLSKAGEVELISLAACAVVSTLQHNDTFTAAAVIATGQPYIVLGCASGSIRIANLVSTTGAPWKPGGPVGQLRLASYGVTAERLQLTGAVQGLDVHSSPGGRVCAVVGSAHGELAVWNFRSEEHVCGAAPSSVPTLAVAGAITCATWLPGVWGDAVATGHVSGCVLVWGVPSTTGAPPTLLHRLTCVQSDTTPNLAPIQTMWRVAGVKGQPLRLLVFGGQPPDEPQLLTMFAVGTMLEDATTSDHDPPSSPPLPPPSPTDTTPQSLHWFGTIDGTALVGERDDPLAAGPPQGALVLTEGGQLMLHDLAQLAPLPLELPYQCLGRPTAACWSSTHAPVAASRSALTVDALKQHAGALAGKGGRAASKEGPAGSPTGDVLAGGTPAGVEELSVWPLYLTGHGDGRVRVWGVAAAAPQLVAMVEAPAETRNAAVATIQVCAASGMLTVGRKSGIVDLFQFLPHPRLVVLHTLDATGESTAIDTKHLQQPAGFQHVLRGRMPGAVTAVELASRHRLLLVGDAVGAVTVIDLARPAVLYALRPSLGPIARLSLVYSVLAATDRRRGVDSRRNPDANIPKLILVLAAADSTLQAVDIERGELLGKPLRPKTASTDTLCLAPLDLEALMTTAVHKHVILSWSVPETVPEDSPLEGEEEGRGGNEGGGDDQGEGSEERLRQGVRGIPPEDSLSSRRSGSGRGGYGGVATTATAATKGSGDFDAMGSMQAPPTAFAGGGGGGSGQWGEEEGGLVHGHVHAGSRTFSFDQASSELGDIPTHPPPPPPGSPPTASTPSGSALPTTRSSHGGDSAPASEFQQGLTTAMQSMDLSDRGSVSARSSVMDSSRRKSARDRLTQLQAFYGTDAVQAERVVEERRASIASEHTLSPYASANFEDLDPTDAHPTIVAYVLAVTEQYARLYHYDHVRTGDRTAMHKVTFDDPVAAAGTWASAACGPALTCVTVNGTVNTYALPSLSPVSSASITTLMGASWSDSSDASWMHNLNTASVAADGQLLLFGPYGQMLRVQLVKDAPQPLPCGPLIDWDMEQALYASSTLQQTQLQRGTAGGGGASSSGSGSLGERGSGQQEKMQGGEGSVGGLSSSASTEIIPPPSTSGKQPTSLSALKKAGFSTFITNVVTKVVDASADVADNLNAKLLGQLGGAREAPPLDAVFAKTTAWPETSAVPGNSTAANSSSVNTAAAAADRRALLGGPVSGGEGPSGSNEHRLAQAGRAVGPDGKPKARTAEEIRAAYGAKQKRADSLQGVMAENADLLRERGEKLKQLQDRTTDMQNEASDFASMAKKLAENERKWF